MRSAAAALDAPGRRVPAPPHPLELSAEDDLAALVAAGRGGLVAVHARRTDHIGRIVERASTQTAIDDNLDHVVDRLDAGGVPYFVIAHQSAHRAVVGVHETHREATLKALRGETDSGAVGYLAAVHRKRVLRGLRADSDAVAGLADEPVLRFYEVTATSDGVLLTGSAEGCDIEFWSSDPQDDDVWIAPRANRLASTLTPDLRTAATTDHRGRELATHPAFLVEHACVISFPIDAVYTWVDGEDPQWRARKEDARLASGIAESDLSVRPSRYASRDELRYSLRSLDRYAEWIRTVYIVTDDQVPEWLDTSNPRVKVVSHGELFAGSGLLPTFNSHAIETKLHHVPGLAEHYLYLNDDVFFGRRVTPERFFESNGLHRVFPSPAQFGAGPVTADEPSVDAAGKNNRELLAARYGRTVTNKFKHAPHAMRRSLAATVEEDFAPAVARTARTQFRSVTDIAMVSLCHYVAWLTGQATIGRIRYEYVNVSVPEAAERLERLLDARDVDAFCLNDTDTADHHEAAQAALLHSFLAAYFPLRSSFERPVSEPSVP